MTLHDPMTEQEYKNPIDSFQQDGEPQGWWEVDVLGGGREALEDANAVMGVFPVVYICIMDHSV